MAPEPAFRPLPYGECLARLAAIPREGTSPRLEATCEMLDEVGRPETLCDFLQVAGTNGKTSTARFCAAILRGRGLRVGLFTSPHLVSPTERMEVDGEPVSEADFARAVSVALAAAEHVNANRAAAGLEPYDVTEFAVLTVAATRLFCEAGCDVAVLEVGMGGRWDPTTAVVPRVSAVTGIGLDHTRVLGDTLELIAAEKAGVIRRGVACVLGPGALEPASVAAVMRARCAKQGVVAREVGEADVARATPLCAGRPAYQRANVAVALAVCEAYLGRPLAPEEVAADVAVCPTPGRFEELRRDPLVLVDASHNPQGVASFVAACAERWPDPAARPLLLAAMLADKDHAAMARTLAGAFPRVAVCATSSPRALPAAELAREFAAAGRAPERAFGTVAEAAEALAGESYAACGSVTLAGELAALLR